MTFCSDRKKGLTWLQLTAQWHIPMVYEGEVVRPVVYRRHPSSNDGWLSMEQSLAGLLAVVALILMSGLRD